MLKGNIEIKVFKIWSYGLEKKIRLFYVLKGVSLSSFGNSWVFSLMI